MAPSATGVVTWAIATYLVGVSGANREVTEGLSALFAAIVLRWTVERPFLALRERWRMSSADPRS